jgi:two-component system, NtrC family, response regulator HydG
MVHARHLRRKRDQVQDRFYHRAHDDARSYSMTHVLVVEPRSERRAALNRVLADNGFDVTQAADLEPALAALDDIDAVVANASLPGGPGIGLLRIVARAPLILICDHGGVQSAVEAIRAGAAHYFVHPVEPDELIAAIELEVATKGRRPLSRDVREVAPVPLIGRCAAMAALIERIEAVAATDTPILIQGESGTGKERVARALHAASRRRDQPMIALNCAMVPAEMLESELFGYERGAAPGASQSRPGLVEAADRGTLYLEEIAELPLEIQARLLRLVRDGETRRLGATQAQPVDVRLVAATQRDLRRAMEAGQFREDLFYRLGLVALTVPPLRERGDDIIELGRYLLKRCCARLARPEPKLSDDAIEAIRAYPWPGNVRELENAMERAVILATGHSIGADDLGIDPNRARQVGVHAAEGDATTLEDYFVRFVLDHQDGLTETELAHKLGISRKSLWERRQRLNIPRRRTQKRGPRRDA